MTRLMEEMEMHTISGCENAETTAQAGCRGDPPAARKHCDRWTGYNIAHVKNRQHIDLRKHGCRLEVLKGDTFDMILTSGSLDSFNNTKIDHCIFLACEVGGSKFIENSSQNLQVPLNDCIQEADCNHIFSLVCSQNVLPWLAERKIPFTFTSSYLQGVGNRKLLRSCQKAGRAMDPQF
eukprot:766786-Hanusia_phi.AAC.8